MQGRFWFVAVYDVARYTVGMSTAPEHAEIGQRLRAVREGFSDLNQKDWAARHGWNTTQYHGWEKGARRIPVQDAERLADLYGLSLDWVYRGRRDGLSDNARKVL